MTWRRKEATVGSAKTQEKLKLNFKKIEEKVTRRNSCQFCWGHIGSSSHFYFNIKGLHSLYRLRLEEVQETGIWLQHK